MKRNVLVLPVILIGLLLSGAMTMAQTAPEKSAPDSKAAAQAPAITAETPVLSFGNQKVTVEQFQSMMLGTPPQQRRQFFGPGGQKKFAETLARMLVFAHAGEKENLEARPDVAAQLALVRAQVLAFAEQQAIFKRAFVSDREIQKYYDNNKDQLVEDHLLHISISTKSGASGEMENESLRAELQKIRQRALKGEDFKELAKQYSKDSDAAQGGDLGFIGRGKLGEPIDGAVFSLKPGEVSPVIETPGAMSIFKVADQKQETLAEAKDTITEILKNQITQVAMTGLLRENPVTYNDEYFKNDNGANSLTLPVTLEVRKNGKTVGAPINSSITIQRKDK